MHPGILVHRRILSWQKDLANFLRACPGIKRKLEFKELKKKFFLADKLCSVKTIMTNQASILKEGFPSWISFCETRSVAYLLGFPSVRLEVYRI